MSRREEVLNEFTSVLEEARKLLFLMYSSEETASMKTERLERFQAFYDSHVKVIGRCDRASWKMSCNEGLTLPVGMRYEIKINKIGWMKKKYYPYLEIKKSTLGAGEGEDFDQTLFRQSSLGVVANKDFEKGEYVAPYLGDIRPVTGRNMHESGHAMRWTDGEGKEYCS